MENVRIRSLRSTKIVVINQAGLNPARLILELAMIMRLVSHTLKMTSENVIGSTIISLWGVEVTTLSTKDGIVIQVRIITAKLIRAHLFLGRSKSVALKKIIFNIGSSLGRLSSRYLCV